jgi:hypothetical protein
MKQFITTLLAWVCTVTLLSAQPDEKLGAARRSVLVKKVGKEFNPKSPLDEQSLKSYMMPPRKRLLNRSASYYAVASVMEFYANVASDFKFNFSPDYMHLYLGQKRISDTLLDALTLMRETGTVSASFLPYGATEINGEINVTKKFKIRDYLILFRETTREQQRLYDMRVALTRGNPIIVKLNIRKNFLTLNSNNRFWESDKGDIQAAGSRTVVVVGFDESKKAFEVLNFDGMAWGNRGYIWVKYDDLAKYSTTGVIILPPDV